MRSEKWMELSCMEMEVRAKWKLKVQKVRLVVEEGEQVEL
jgi:hypothetical protein